MNKFFSISVGILALALTVYVVVLICVKHKDYKCYNDEVINKTEPITLIQKMNDWNLCKESQKLFNLAMELPEETVQLILQNIGTLASWEDVAEEYLRNQAYYISSQIKNNLPKIHTPGIEDATISISTELNEKEEEIPELNAIVTDSLKHQP